MAVRSGDGVLDRRLGRRDVFRCAIPALQSLLESCSIDWRDLDGIAVMAGPGSFTGLRIGATVGIGLAEVNATALHAVPTLIVVAEALAPASASRVCVSMDARRGRRYAAQCECADGRWEQCRGPVDLDPRDLAVFAADAVDVRLESAGFATALASRLAKIVACSPEAFVVLDPATFSLRYVRPGVEAP